MARVGTLAFLAISCVGTALVVSATTLLTEGCDSAQEKDSPDASPGPCKSGPFAFPAALPQTDTTTPGCSSDDNANLPVIALLPHGTRYPVGDTVNYVGTRDNQDDCTLATVCKCIIPSANDVPTTPADAGDEAGTSQPTTTAPGTPAWTCQ